MKFLDVGIRTRNRLIHIGGDPEDRLEFVLYQ